MRRDPFASVSITFREAPTALRAKLAEELKPEVWDGLVAQGCDGLVTLHTCQRSLWMISGNEPSWLAQLLQAHLERRLGADVPLTVRTGKDAARHLLEVSAGLDAFVQGEADVGAQVAGAFLTARVEGHDGPSLRTFAQAVHDLRAAGRTRGFIRPNRGVGQLAVQALLARGITPADTVGVVGMGAIGQRVVASLERAGFVPAVTYNRTPRDGHRALADIVAHPALVICTAGPPRWFRAPDGTRIVIDIGVPRQTAGAAVDLDDLLSGADLRLDPERLGHARESVEGALGALYQRLRGRSHTGRLEQATELRDRFVAEELEKVLGPALEELTPAQGKKVRAAAEKALRQYNHKVVAWMRDTLGDGS